MKTAHDGTYGDDCQTRFSTATRTNAIHRGVQLLSSAGDKQPFRMTTSTFMVMRKCHTRFPLLTKNLSLYSSTSSISIYF